MQFVQNFLSLPNLADIIAYSLGVIILIYEIFAKLGIKKNNLFTALKISKDINKLESLREEIKKERLELQEDKKLLAEERQKWNQEKDELQNEMNEIKKSVRLISNYSDDLVKTGISKKINKMLPVEDKEVNVNLENQEDNTND